MFKLVLKLSLVFLIFSVTELFASSKMLIIEGFSAHPISQEYQDKFWQLLNSESLFDFNKRLKVKRMIKKGIDVNMRYKNGWTGLHLMVQLNDIKIARLLLENDAYVDAKTDEGETPMDFVANAHVFPIEMHKLLVEYGSNVDLTSCRIMFSSISANSTN